MLTKEDYQKLRENYKPLKPVKINCLLIAESPPKSEDERFFYNPNQEKWDFLFKSIIAVVFPDFEKEYKKGLNPTTILKNFGTI